MATGRIVCIGGACIDRKYRAEGLVRLGTSNPVASERSFGGVARNVAENVARLGVQAELVSAVGQDENGLAVMAALSDMKIGTRHVAVSGEHATAEYVAVLQPDGDLALGLADMAIFSALTPALLREAWAELAPSHILADCNLPSETLHELIRLARRDAAMLAVDAVSSPKVKRLPRDLTGIGLLFLNADEAQAFLSDSGSLPDTAAALALLERGAARVILTLGATGLIAAEGSDVLEIPAIPAQALDATGAGDALIAATLVALLDGKSLADAARFGAAAAALTVESPASVRPDLSPALLEAALSRKSARTFEREPL